MSKSRDTYPACIAVLPFENFSGDRQQDYFSLGFAEEIITDLAHFPNLHVISSYTSRKIKSEQSDELSVSKELAINYLLKGNVNRQAGHIRINAQLINVSDGSVVWAERYNAALDTIFEIQDDIVERVVGALSIQINRVLLAAARNKPLTSMAAYDCWLRGMEFLRSRADHADTEARRMFRQAIKIDPNYSRAYAGLSLSYFNDWSCQLWEDWDATEKSAYEYALQAIELDDSDYIVQMVLGRILVFRHQFDQAGIHLDKSLELNSNDADSLVQISFCKAFLGFPQEGEALFERAIRLNPYRNMWYYTYGAFACFAQRRYQDCINLALKGPLTEVWVDLPAFIAAAYAYLGDHKQAGHYLSIFVETFQKQITMGRSPRPGEIAEWVRLANPFRDDADMDHVIDGLYLAGLDNTSGPKVDPDKPGLQVDTDAPTCSFNKEMALWHITYEGTSVQLPEVKGFHDLVTLLTHPGEEFHCAVLMGAPVDAGGDDAVIDEKARRFYEDRIRELKAEIRESEDMNDLGRLEGLRTEYNQLVDHLSKTLGLGKRVRKINPGAERARAAVTWRIRSAIRKIDSIHPALGRHLTNAVQTGTFCSYTPEKDCGWQT